MDKEAAFEDFKFQLGDIVRWRDNRDRGVVVHRMLVQTQGGVSREYGIRRRNYSGCESIGGTFEIELELDVPPPAKA